MRIVITGGLGFIGQNFAHHIRSKPVEAHITAIDWFEDVAPEEKAPFDDIRHCCFTDPAALEAVTGADVLVHLAARTTVQESIDDPMATFEENVVKFQTLLDHIRLHSPKTKIIFASTGGAIIGEYDGAINEEIAANPLSPYGASKLAAEGLLSAYRGSFNISSAAMRFSNVYGPNSFRKGSVVATYCKMYLNNGTVQVNGDGKQTRDYIYVDDISEAIWRVLDQDGQGVFQLGTGIGTSINDLVKAFQAIDPTVKPEYADPLNGEVRHNRADISRIQNELSFTPECSLNDGVRKTLDWFKAYQK